MFDEGCLLGAYLADFLFASRPCGDRFATIDAAVHQRQSETEATSGTTQRARINPEAFAATVTKITSEPLNLPYARSIKSPSGVTARIR